PLHPGSGPPPPAEPGALPELPGVLTGEQVRTTVGWIAGQQDADGALPWFAGGQLDPWDAPESNPAGYLAVGLWHRWLITGDEELVTELWPVVRRGLDLVVRMQLPGGAISWALRGDGSPDDTALLTGNA